MRFALGVALLLFSSLLAWSQAAPASQVELNGFLLGQYIKAADGTFGKPYEVRKAEVDSTDHIYVFDKAHSGYMVFEASSDRGEQIISIQIAGKAATPMRPFLGLVLGDSKSKLLQAIGSPTKVEHEKDYDVDLYTYAHRNYSFEVDPEGKLSSIRISGYVGFTDKPPSGFPDVEQLRRVIVGCDVDGLLTLLAGGIEIYKGDKTYDFARAARTELQERNSDVHRFLLGESDSLRSAFTTEKFDPDMQIRIYEKVPPGSVAKFDHSKVVKEVVYRFEAGTWKVWEIEFR